MIVFLLPKIDPFMSTEGAGLWGFWGVSYMLRKGGRGKCYILHTGPLTKDQVMTLCDYFTLNKAD